MDGEIEERPGQEETLAATHRSIEKARENLDEEQRRAARRELGGWLVKMRENKWLRGPAKRLGALFLGVPLSAGAAEPLEARRLETAAIEVSIPLPEQPETAPADTWHGFQDIDLTAFNDQLQRDHDANVPRMEREAFHEARYPETDGFYAWELLEIAKAIEGGEAAPEYYARVGLSEWTPYHRSLFADAPVGERFVELHPEYRRLSNAEFIAAYPDMLAKAQTEFRFSNQFRFLTDDMIDLFVADVADMPPEAALERYKMLMETIGRNVGLAKAVGLTDRMLERLPTEHPVAAYATTLGLNQARQLLGRSKQNIVHMDQAAGELRVTRRIGDRFVLIDSFPAIGGNLNSPEMSVAGKPAGSEFVHVPDTVMKVAYVDRAKTSWSWHNSWVPQGAPIREKGDDLQYQHPATKQWYDLTGPNAAFFPDREGKAIRPFDGDREPMDGGLIRAATHEDPATGNAYVPRAWTKEQIVARAGGEIPTEWKWNDFGSMAVRLNTSDGERTNINIHSKPNQDMNDFLGGRTHGCFATYGEYVKVLADEYGMGSGSTVVVTTEASYDLKKLLGQK